MNDHDTSLIFYLFIFIFFDNCGVRVSNKVILPLLFPFNTFFDKPLHLVLPPQTKQRPSFITIISLDTNE